MSQAGYALTFREYLTVPTSITSSTRRKGYPKRPKERKKRPAGEGTGGDLVCVAHGH